MARKLGRAKLPARFTSAEPKLSSRRACRRCRDPLQNHTYATEPTSYGPASKPTKRQSLLVALTQPLGQELDALYSVPRSVRRETADGASLLLSNGEACYRLVGRLLSRVPARPGSKAPSRSPLCHSHTHSGLTCGAKGALVVTGLNNQWIAPPTAVWQGSFYSAPSISITEYSRHLLR